MEEEIKLIAQQLSEEEFELRMWQNNLINQIKDNLDKLSKSLLQLPPANL